MGVLLSMSGKKAPRKPDQSSGKGGKVVAHPGTGIRDVERMLRYVKSLDKERGRR